ncbi:MAG TPA: ABC transporter permease, partial [Acetobacteraceae bacterium]|nr:ABC transporter permease [Acetobacteraceae bacterium]
MMRRAGPIAAVLLVVLAVWYVAAVWMNYDTAANLADEGASRWDIVAATMQQDRPLLPAPHQIVGNMVETIFFYPPTSPRSLLYHAAVTAFAAGLGFVIALVLGIALAIGIVHVRTLERSLMLWIIASQTVPVLAIAPMVVVVLGNIGLTGVLPKALI